jgi:lysophospholipase L1-like esterase
VFSTPTSKNWGFTDGVDVRAKRTSALINAIATDAGVSYFDIGSITPPSSLDGIHFDASAQPAIAASLAPVVRDLLNSSHALH